MHNLDLGTKPVETEETELLVEKASPIRKLAKKMTVGGQTKKEGNSLMASQIGNLIK